MNKSDETRQKLSEQSLRQLINDTIDAMGPLDATEMPHRIKAKLSAHIRGEEGIEALIAEAISRRGKGE